MGSRPDDHPRKKIDISLLQTFHHVARSGSFSAAARELNISYQSAANHVRRLEQMYGAKLVEAEKGSRLIHLTPQGKALRASLGRELETILSRISVLMHDVRTVLRVGVPQALFHHFFARVLAEFRQRDPDIELSFFERDTILEEMMLEGSLDVCISERHFGDSVITQHLICEYRLSLIYPQAWFDRTLTESEIGLLIDRPFISYEPGQTIRSRSLDFLSGIFGQEPNISTSTSGSTSIANLIKAGLGYAIVPQWCVPDGDRHVPKIILDGVKPVKIYYGNSAFLENNEYVTALYEACRNVILTELEGD
ncbi:LysR family transcriptional regulator [Magnetospira sp. QH-2]|uniref:LysR family transcriptional regulator n=1 Tax=Magnetospira sp. (strain QH-2) TaxID=1288970 RepID=UPI0003E81A4E|nr:LysR family transcriptional regulator [Magnetospira sp. QH-2]CCQ72145.1 Transcriptional regulator, LysR-family [Magnetospira sp. QH-2]